jgi:hypothetical protein
MIAAFIFAAHLVFALIIFTIKWQNENLKSAFLNIVLIGILFSVGWTITTMIAKLALEHQGFGLYFDRDAFSLTILTIAEYFFYRFYYSEEPTEAEKEKQ